MGVGLKRVGVIGTMIWDTVTGRDGLATSEEWGGISYSLAALDASLPADWKVAPLVKVGRDRAASAASFLKDLSCIVPGGRFIETPGTNPRVKLRYQDLERRAEEFTGFVPPWTWEELGTMVLGLDAIYANYISGFETDLATMQSLRRAFKGPIYGDIHSLSLGITETGLRYLRPLEEALAWLTCFDFVQINEAEMAQLGPEPLSLAARALELGVKAICITLGARGTIYVAASGEGSLIRTALLSSAGGPAEGDPTGCGDVFGGTLVANLLAGAPLEEAVRAANRMAKRNVTYRGAAGLQHHLKGALQLA